MTTHLVIWHDGGGSTYEASCPKVVIPAATAEDAEEIEKAMVKAIESSWARSPEGWTSILEVPEATYTVEEATRLVNRLAEWDEESEEERFHIEYRRKYGDTPETQWESYPDPLPGGEVWEVLDYSREGETSDELRVFAGHSEEECERFLANLDD